MTQLSEYWSSFWAKHMASARMDQAVDSLREDEAKGLVRSAPVRNTAHRDQVFCRARTLAQSGALQALLCGDDDSHVTTS